MPIEPSVGGRLSPNEGTQVTFKRQDCFSSYMWHTAKCKTMETEKKLVVARHSGMREGQKRKNESEEHRKF